jgi:hypothetical protein
MYYSITNYFFLGLMLQTHWSRVHHFVLLIDIVYYIDIVSCKGRFKMYLRNNDIHDPKRGKKKRFYLEVHIKR